MAYACALNATQTIYVENRGTQTTITSVSSSPGQQQQASTSVTTGAWTAPPEMSQTPGGAVLKIQTAQGDRYVQIQGNSMGATSQPGAIAFQPMSPANAPQPASDIPPMQPMSPMEPMQMGDMRMSMNPMEMRMGNMSLSMGHASASADSASSPPPGQTSRRFCSQCGVAVKADDRFCSSCGHQL